LNADPISGTLSINTILDTVVDGSSNELVTKTKIRAALELKTKGIPVTIILEVDGVITNRPVK
jgi:hypothetical protein